MAVHIPINRRQYWLYSQHCLYFPFPVYLEIEGKSENFFCCLNKCLITVYVFQLVRNKKTISLLELKRLTLKNPNPGSQQPLIKQGLDLVHLTLPVVLACAHPHPAKICTQLWKASNSRCRWAGVRSGSRESQRCFVYIKIVSFAPFSHSVNKILPNYYKQSYFKKVDILFQSLFLFSLISHTVFTNLRV